MEVINNEREREDEKFFITRKIKDDMKLGNGYLASTYYIENFFHDCQLTQRVAAAVAFTASNLPACVVFFSALSL